MREALGGSMLLNLVLIFAGIVIVFFIGILSYSKAYRVKNRIIEITEKYGVYDATVAAEISPDLKAAGYDSTKPTRCNNIRGRLIDSQNGKYNDLGQNINDPSNDSSYGYNYCVYEVTNSSVNNSGKYYVVVSFIKFEFPVIGDLLTIPVYGETKMLGKSYNY